MEDIKAGQGLESVRNSHLTTLPLWSYLHCECCPDMNTAPTGAGLSCEFMNKETNTYALPAMVNGTQPCPHTGLCRLNPYLLPQIRQESQLTLSFSNPRRFNFALNSLAAAGSTSSAKTRPSISPTIA